MGQAMRKLTGKVDEVQAQKQQKEEMRKIIDNYIQAHLKEFESAVETWDGFYHMVYEIAEHLSEKSGAMQFKLPPIETLRAEYTAACGTEKLTKEKFNQIISKVVSTDSFYVGQGARDVFLYIFGVPVLALLAKRVIPGPTQSISDDIVIPVATTGTVVYLARTNRL